MTTLTIEISDELFSQLKALADDAQISVNHLVNKMIHASLLDENDEPTDEEIIHDIRQSLKDELAGNVRPLGEVLDELRREIFAG
mgnify:CR=1 FL=1